MSVAKLTEDMAAYEEMRRELELDHNGKFVLIYDRELIGVYEDFPEAAKVAISRFGRGPYHIRKVGETTIPASMSMSGGSFPFA